MNKLLDTLSQLSSIRGISGNEESVSQYITKRLDKLSIPYTIDPMGNLIAFKKGTSAGNKKLMICAHMDEVGFIIQSINSDGTLKFAPVGGVQPEVTCGRKVSVGEDGSNIYGVIGLPAVHGLSADDKKKLPKISDLAIDIGATSKEDAEKYVSVGDPVTFTPVHDFEKLGELLVGRAIDDRAGCAMMIHLLEEQLPVDITFVFTVQEEIGTRGAKAATFTVQPDIAIVLEATTAADLPSAEGEKKVCIVNNGPVVSFMDRSTIYDRELYKLAFSTASKANIPIQTKTMVAGGNDSGAIHVSGKGVRTLAISLPCRYLHSESCVISPKDLSDAFNLTREIISQIV